MFSEIQERFIRYAKINTRSDESSSTIPSTRSQVKFAHLLVEELEEIGLADIEYNAHNGFVTASLLSTIEKEVPVIGFIAHMDTADFSSENIQPQIHPNYDGKDILLNQGLDIVLSPRQFPQLKSYVGQTLITTDGTTLLGADDKAGIAEIITAVSFLKNHPEIPHGKIKLAFGPDEEIGRGAKHFDVKHFGADFAYTVDGGPVGELQYESFNAAQANIKVQGVDVHPGTAKDKMINAIHIGMDIIQALPEKERPEYTDARQGFYHVMDFSGSVENSELSLIIRDFDKQEFEKRKNCLLTIVNDINSQYGPETVTIDLYDQYYNMAEVIEEDPLPINLAAKAMENIGLEPIIQPIRGGTDGSILSFMGLPAPNLFAGGENFHGKYEFVAVESMLAATETLVEIARLQAQL